MPGTIGTTHRKHVRRQQLDRYRKDRVSRFSQWLDRELTRLSVTSPRALRDSLRDLGVLSPAEIEGAATAADANVLEASITATFAVSADEMAGGPDLTIAAGVITRSAGNFVTDGFANGQFVNIAGADLDPANQGRKEVATVAATTLTLATGEDSFDEGPISGASIIGDDTLTRGAGDFGVDGFAVGDTIQVAGAVNAENDGERKIAAEAGTVVDLEGVGYVAEAATASVDVARVDPRGR